MPKTDPFARLIPDARAFLSELAANNSRDWFGEHKARYESDLKTPATLLADQFAHDIRRDTGQSLTTKLFRPHRDVRFSKDKTPYHTHLHMLWTIETPERQKPGFFFGIAPDYISIGGGVMGFDKAVLTDWRKAVDGTYGTRMQAELAALAANGLSAREPELKRVPAPYAKDHPQAELLRRKGLVVWHELPANAVPAPLAALKDTFARMQTFYGLMQEVISPS